MSSGHKKKAYRIESSSEESDVSVTLDSDSDSDDINPTKGDSLQELVKSMSHIVLDGVSDASGDTTTEEEEDKVSAFSPDELKVLNDDDSLLADIGHSPRKSTKQRKSIIVISSAESSDTENNNNNNLVDAEEEVIQIIEEPPKNAIRKPLPIGRIEPKTQQPAKVNLEKLMQMKDENAEKEKPKPKPKPVKKLIHWTQLDKDTRVAEKAEKDRCKRIEARQTLFDEYFGNDEKCKGVLDFDVNTKKTLAKIHDAFVPLMKQHQIEGVKFLYDSIIESVERFTDDDIGSGAILAHSMGLGKTMQIVVFLHSIMTNRHLQNDMERVLIIVPYNVIENWADEFDKWFTHCGLKFGINIYEMRTAKTINKRIDLLKSWYSKGGILLITSNLFSRLVTNDKHDNRAKSVIRKTLLSPGPHLVIIDEGHLLKNDSSIFNAALSQIDTGRRIVLTGTPLQNNLMEYYVMVEFVKPSLLGTKKEFKNRFDDPVKAGQDKDSGKYEVTLMKRRVHVLTQMLKGCIHRCDYNILVPYLPPKYEVVISLKLSDVQIAMYKHYLEFFADKSAKNNKNFLSDKNLLSLIWTHPSLMHDYYQQSNEGNKETRVTSYGQWYLKYINEEDIYNSGLSCKFTLLFAILELCEKVGDKIIIFSQSLLTLNLIERLLKLKMKQFIDDFREKNNIEGYSNYEELRRMNGGVSNRWKRDVDYFRIDGSVDSGERSEVIDKFNDVEDTRARLMLVSTRAGGIGINLVGANRAIIFDASFNPSHDLQAIFRIFRLGQKKPVYVYRFTAFGTMEDKIYKRQIVKQSLSGRVVDEQQILRHYSTRDLTEMYLLDTNYPEDPNLQISKDDVLNDLIFNYSDLIMSYHEHDSLLENRPEEELTEEERKAAWTEFEKSRQNQNNAEQVVALGAKMGKMNMNANNNITQQMPNKSQYFKKNLLPDQSHRPIELDPSEINIVETID